jgi:hypothetical protein
MPNQGCVLPALYLPFFVSALKSVERVKGIEPSLLLPLFKAVAAPRLLAGFAGENQLKRAS